MKSKEMSVSKYFIKFWLCNVDKFDNKTLYKNVLFFDSHINNLNLKTLFIFMGLCEC